MEDQQLSDEQKLGLAAIALLTPALGGAMGGRDGAMAGASIGLKAAGGAWGDIGKEQQKKADAATAEKKAEAKYNKERGDRVEDAIKIDEAKKKNAPERPISVQTKEYEDTDGTTKLGRIEGGKLVKTPEDQVVKLPPKEKPPKDISVSERNTLQTQYDRDPEIRKNKEVLQSYAAAQALVKDPSPASDQALVYAYMKALDPGSVVRETEAESAQALGGLQERAKAKLSQMSGSGTLTPDQRKDLVAQIEKLAMSAAERQSGLDQQFQGLAARRGVANEDLRFVVRPQFAPTQTTQPSGNEAIRAAAAAELQRRREAAKGGK